MRWWRGLGVGLALVLVLLVFRWTGVLSHDDTFTNEGLIRRDTSELPATTVSSHLEITITDRNILWCATFQLAWNELCDLLGGDVQFEGDNPAAVAWLNQRAANKDQLAPGSFVALADYARNDPYAQIQQELKRTFQDAASPRLMPSGADSRRPDDIVAYAYLFRNLAFPTAFECVDDPLMFEGTPVRSFGTTAASRSEVFDQFAIHDFQHENDFVVSLESREADENVVLAKTAPGATLGETIRGVLARMRSGVTDQPSLSDTLRVPMLNIDIKRRYTEFEQRSFVVVSQPATSGRLVAAIQRIRFQLDETGARLQSEAVTVAGLPQEKRLLIFDRPFLIMLKRVDSDTPYFAMWIANPELLVKV